MSTHADGAVTAAVETTTLTYREAINAAMADELATDPAVVLMGEDVATAGGVFKTNDGLADRFGTERIRNTPICENTFVGVALGMAVTGLRPIVEVMFSDFLPTAADAVVNELPKFRFMSGGQCNVPVTVRAIGGGSGRFGTQHSATGESWYMALPGLKVATLGSPAAAYEVLRAAIRDDDPVLVFEHKGMYSRKGEVHRGDVGIAELGKARLMRSGSDVTIVATMLMVDRAMAAAERLSAEGVDAEVIDLCWLRPLDVESVADSVARTGRLVVVEEQVHAAGWGATLISELAMRGAAFRSAPRAVSMRDDVLVPYSPPLEDALIPSADAVVAAVRRALR